MLTLVESAKRSTNPLEKGIIELYAQNSPVLEHLPFKNIKGNTYTKRIEATLSGVGSRAINTDYTDSTSENAVAAVSRAAKPLRVARGELSDCDCLNIECPLNPHPRSLLNLQDQRGLAPFAKCCN